MTVATTASTSFAAESDGLPTLRLEATIIQRSGEAGGNVLRLQSSPQAKPGATYMLQTRERLDSGSPWITHEPVPAVSSVLTFEWPLRGESTSFFRLQAPEPAIFRVEPAVLSIEGGEVFIIGQCLGTNGTVQFRSVAGAVIPGGSVLSSALGNRCLVPPMPPGIYDVEWLEEGNVMATAEKLLSISPQVQPGGILQRLLEPPTEPPASPMKVRKGGMVKGNITVNSANRTGGKKGINAVNVKLARQIAGGDDDADYLQIQPFSGELVVSSEDLSIPGRGLDFSWVRTYRSRTGRTTPMGINWDHSYNLFVEQEAGGVAVNDGTGRRDVYFAGTNGIYARNEFFNEGRLSNGSFTLMFPDTGKWLFHSFDGSAVSGKISRIEDRNGNALRFEYDDTGRLVHVIDTLDRTNTIAYVGEFISSVTDFTGRTVRYQYYGIRSLVGGPGDLATATSPPVTGTPNGNDFPSGKTTTYSYSKGFGDESENHLLLSITDPKGQTPHRFVYQHNQTDLEFLRCVRMTAGEDTNVLTFSCVRQAPGPDNQFATMKCIVNDAVGNVSEHYYDSLNRCVRQLDFTGRAIVGAKTTETENRPAGKLREGDPDFYETRWEWNADSLCTRVVNPIGNNTEYIYQRAYNQNEARSNHRRRHDGDLRVRRERACCADADGDGLPDLAAREWRFEYDPQFGSPGQRKTTPGHKYVDTLTLRAAGFAGDGTPIIKGSALSEQLRKGWDGTVKGLNFADADADAPLAALQDAFVTRQTDPRGATELCTYDARGNRTSHAGPVLAGGVRPMENYEYNAFGQLTAVVHAADGEGRRRRDEGDYHDSGPETGYLRHHVTDAVAGGFRLTNTFEYDARGNLIRHVNPNGYDTLHIFNALDQRISMNVTVPKQTQGATFGERMATFFSYDANDNLVRVDHENRDPSGALDPVNPLWTTAAEYDVLNRKKLLAHELTHVAQQGGGVQSRIMTNQFVYDGNGNLVFEQLPEAANGNDPDNVVAYQYDERDLLFQVLPAPGTGQAATERFDYDANGNCVRVSKVDAFSIKVKSFQHDGFDRCVEITDAMGNVAAFGYDLNDNLTSELFSGELSDVAGGVNNRRLSETRHVYDGLNRPVRRIDSFFDIITEVSLSDGGSTHSSVYAPNGLLLRETDDNGNTTRYRYDSADRLSGQSRGLLEAGPFEEGVQMLAYVHDAAGNVVSVTQTDRSDLGGALQSFITSYVYDEWDRCLSTSNNVGNVVRFAYDSSDNCVSEIDERDNEVTRVFDGLGRVTDTTYYEGAKERGITINTSHVEYSTTRCVSTTDGNGNTTTYAYDSVDRLTTTTYADKSSVSLVWSPRSNLSSSTDANGTVVTYTHDLLDRLVRKDIAPGPDVAATTIFEEFSYDGLSRLVRGLNNSSSVEFGHDSLGNCIRATEDGLSSTATFDGEGNRLSLTYPGGRVMQSTFARGNLLSAVGSIPFAGGALSSVANFSYDGLDRLARISRANGVNTRINWNGLLNTANSAGDFGWQQVVRVNHARAQGGAVIDQRVFAYDLSQNKTVRAQTTGFSQGSATTTNSFAYDPMHRLSRGTRVTGPVNDYARTYALDANGNRQQVIQDGAVSHYQMDNTLPEPADFQLNQYTLTPFGAEHHDRNGNVVFRDSATGGTMFRYDYTDRLVSVDQAVGPALVTIASYAYDALGRRISKTTYPPTPAAPVTTRFTHDSDSEDATIMEIHRDGVLAASFFWLPEVGDEVLVAFTPTGTPIYFHGDDLGNTLALTGEAGEVLERYDYDDYGSPRFLDSKGAPILVDGQVASASPLGNPLLFHGMFWDAETALYHDKGMSGENPMYAPNTGRYMGRGHRDLGGYRAGASAFTFAGDNPWTGNSPSRMKKGTVKFFNETKGFGRMSVMFNPREYILRKVTVRGWDPEKKEAIAGNARKKEEGGRHTPFHTKYRPQFFSRITDVTGEIELESGREMTTGLDVEYRLHGPGQAHWGNAKFTSACTLGGSKELQAWFQEAAKGKNIRKSISVRLGGSNSASRQFNTLSNASKNRHDAAMNSIRNIH